MCKESSLNRRWLYCTFPLWSRERWLASRSIRDANLSIWELVDDEGLGYMERPPSVCGRTHDNKTYFMEPGSVITRWIHRRASTWKPKDSRCRTCRVERWGRQSKERELGSGWRKRWRSLVRHALLLEASRCEKTCLFSRNVVKRMQMEINRA